MPNGKERRPVLAPGGPPRDPDDVKRDASSFDFREVVLVTALVLRPDLMKEYLDDGRDKDAVHNPEKWPNLRKMFDPEMLAEFLYLFELPETQTAAVQIKRVFDTMINLNDYNLAGCPNSNYLAATATYAGQLTAPLSVAGVKVS